MKRYTDINRRRIRREDEGRTPCLPALPPGPDEIRRGNGELTAASGNPGMGTVFMVGKFYCATGVPGAAKYCEIARIKVESCIDRKPDSPGLFTNRQ